MADENDNVEFRLSLDNADFLKKLLEAKGHILEMGDSKNLEGLLKGFGEVGAAIAVAGAAVYALSKGFESVFEAEQINAINDQFERLTKNAGISTETLKSGLEQAAGGLVDDTELLKIANKSIIEMGNSAKQLPEVMNVARKATAAMGGDLAQNFEQINQAIATGQVRQLRNLGIVIDEQKAYRDYAKSIGAAASELDQAGRQHAIMNAVLEKGKTAFEGVDVNIKESTDKWTRLKVTLAQIGEDVTMVFSRIFKPVVDIGLKGMNAVASGIEHLLQGLRGVKDASKEVRSLAGEAASNANDTGGVDVEKQKQNQAKYLAQMAEFNQKRLAGEIQLAENFDAFDKLMQQKRDQERAKSEAKDAEIRASQELNDQQKNNLIAANHQALVQKLKLMESDLDNARKQYLDNYLRNSRSTADGIEKAFKVAGTKAKTDLGDFSKVGQQTFDSFQKHSTDALLAMGAGTKSATEAMKGMFLNMIADRAEAEGSLLMLAGIADLNPLEAAGGAALIGLAGFLRSQAGGGGSSAGVGGVSAGAGGIGGGIGAGETYGTRTDTPPTLNDVKGKNVTINLQGNMFGTDETNRWLVEQIRQASDATDFKIQSIGGGL